jgi:alkylhydroperoxidase family enzyme
MPRIQPIEIEQSGALRPLLEAAAERMGFLPNSQRILAHRPEILAAFRTLADAINGPSATIDRALRSLVAQMASRAAGCAYCMAHTAHSAARSGVAGQGAETRQLFRPNRTGSRRPAFLDLRSRRGAAQSQRVLRTEIAAIFERAALSRGVDARRYLTRR